MKTKLLTTTIFLWMNLTISSIVFSSEEYVGSAKRDPFVPLVSGEKEAIRGLYGVETIDDLHVEGIVYDVTEGSAAIVNGEIVREGEIRDNITVIKIKPNGVMFKINDSEEFKSFGNDE